MKRVLKSKRTDKTVTLNKSKSKHKYENKLDWLNKIEPC